MKPRTPVKRKRTKPRRGPLRDPKYLAWIRTLPCVCCFIFLHAWDPREYFLRRGPHGASEAAHVGLRGIAQKCSDHETIPLCGFHHRTGPSSHHRLQKRFWAYWEIDRAALIAELNARFMEEQGK